MNAKAIDAPAERTVIGSVVKALDVLSEIARRPDGASAGEVAAALSMPAPSAYHLLNTLALSDVLTKGRDRRYRLGPRIAAWSTAYYAHITPDERLVGPLSDLADQTGETAYLTSWRAREIEVIASAEGSHALRVGGLERGSHGHAHARASGKLLLALATDELRDFYLSRHDLIPMTPNTIVDRDALLAHLEEIAETGYAVDNEELVSGISCISVPIRHDGLVIGAYTISAPTERFRVNRDDLLTAAQAAAAKAADPARDLT